MVSNSFLPLQRHLPHTPMLIGLDVPTHDRSTSDFCVFLGTTSFLGHLNDNPQSPVQVPRPRIAVLPMPAETIWLRNLLLELHYPLSTATIAYCDNVSAIYLSTNSIQHQRTKHVELDILFVRERVALGQVRVFHIPSSHQYADIFTKGLSVALFKEFKSSLHVQEPHVLTARGY